MDAICKKKISVIDLVLDSLFASLALLDDGDDDDC